MTFLGVGDITGISRFSEKTIRTAIRFCNTGISAISGNHRLFPLTAQEKAPVIFS